MGRFSWLLTPAGENPLKRRHSDDRALPTEHFACERHALELADVLELSEAVQQVGNAESTPVASSLLSRDSA
jgi:hypothetical protein